MGGMGGGGMGGGGMGGGGAPMRAARGDAMDWAERAKSALAELPDHPVRDMLSDLADFVVSRVA